MTVDRAFRYAAFALLIAAPGIAHAQLPLTGATAIAAGGDHTCAITATGGVKCWGRNHYGQVGDGSTADRLMPVFVYGLTSGVTAIAAGGSPLDGGHTCALTSAGGVKCWGRNAWGQLGDGSEIDRATPVDVTGLASGVTAISLGEAHTCARLGDGSVKCWGRNDHGQLGNGTLVSSTTPVTVQFVNAIGIAAGGLHTCAALGPSFGSEAMCWGYNLAGQLGTGNTTQATTADYVCTTYYDGDCFDYLNDVSMVTAGYYHTCAFVTSSGAMCWGHNFYGAIGDGTTNTRVLPVQVTILATAIVAGAGHTCAIVAGGGAKCWGANFDGTIGDGSTTQRNSPVDVSGLASGVTALAAGGSHTCALLGGGAVKCWGRNVNGQVGDGTTVNKLVPTYVVVPPFTLQARYRLGEDDAGSSLGGPGAATTTANVGTINLARSGTAQYVAGAQGQGLALSLESGFYTSPSFVSTLTDDFGVEVWLKGNGNAGNTTIAYVGHGSTSGYGLIQADNEIAGLYGGVEVLFTGGPTPVTTVWTHYALVRAGGISRIYVNGQPVGPTFTSGPAPASSLGTTVGGFQGAVDDARFFTFEPGAFDASQLNVRSLTVQQAGLGEGSVAADVGPISCGSTCTGHYPTGTVVTLTATPVGGSDFTGWSGGGCAGTGTCVVTLAASTTVTATFGVAAPPSAPRSGFNGDARSDVLWRNSSTGQVYQWQMNGLAISGQGYMPSVPTNWIAAAVGDTNADGNADVFWRESGGLNYLWIVSGLGITSQGYLPSVPNPWIVVGMGDASGDGKADVFWRNPTSGQNYLWIMNGLSITSQAYLPSVSGSDWELVGVADYSGDGKADALWRNKATGQNYLWVMNGLVVASQGFLPTVAGSDWEVVGSPDANGDGKADALWRHKTTGQNYLWVMNGLAVTSQGFLPSVAGTDWKVVGFGDYNGDGRGDALWRNTSTGQNYLWILNGLAVASQGYLPNVTGSSWMPVK